MSWAALAGKGPGKEEGLPQQRQQQSRERPDQGRAGPPLPPVWSAEHTRPVAAAAAADNDSSVPPASAPSPAAAGTGSVWGQPGRSFLSVLAPEQAEVAALSLPGLRNESGEFNCFLNVVLQCLWRCADFRAEVGEVQSAGQAGCGALQNLAAGWPVPPCPCLRACPRPPAPKVLGWSPAAYLADDVLRELHALFAELTALDMHRQEVAQVRGEWSAGACRCLH